MKNRHDEGGEYQQRSLRAEGVVEPDFGAPVL